MPMKKQAGSPINNPIAWTDPDDAPKLTADMLDRAEVFVGEQFVRRARGRPKSPAAKELISVRLDPDVVATLRKAGPGWQSQINAMLREALGLKAAAPKDAMALEQA